MARYPWIGLAFVLLVVSVKGQETDHEIEFEYGEGQRGPQHWGDLKREWKACGHGHRQSPIDLVKGGVQIFPRLGKLRRSYRPANATLKNRGHDIMVKWAEGAGGIHIDGINFTLMQCHWHSPAEHTVNGTRYPLEIHMVHQSARKQFAVLGILYKYGRPDTFLAELMDEIRSISDMNPPVETLGVVNPKHIKLGSRKYYRYVGSLTTPPCTEGVVWTIVEKVRTVSRDQVTALITAVNDGFRKNSRPTQDANGRIVRLYTPRRTPPHL